MTAWCRLASLLVLALASTACLGSGHSVNAYGGKRFLQRNDWDNVDNPTVYGLDAVLALEVPWLGVEGGWFHSEDDSNAFPEGLEIDDYFVGLRATPWKFLLEPYASAGLTYVDSHLDDPSAVDSDETSIAYYLRLGAAFTLGIVRLGLDGRALFNSETEFDGSGVDSDVDNYQLTAFVGLGF